MELGLVCIGSGTSGQPRRPGDTSETLAPGVGFSALRSSVGLHPGLAMDGHPEHAGDGSRMRTATRRCAVWLLLRSEGAVRWGALHGSAENMIAKPAGKLCFIYLFID